MHAPIRVGVIGLGRLGSLYARYFTSRFPAARLHAVSDVQVERLQEVTRETGAPCAYADYRRLLEDPAVDAVIVTPPTRLHGEVVLAAVEAKKAIFCEKPLSLELAEAEAMKGAVDRSGTFFQLGFMRRFDRAYAAAKRMVDEGRIGAPVVFKSTSKDQYPPPVDYLRPANSGGLFIDMGIHDFDLARWFMGEATRVYSAGGALAYPEIGDVGDVDNAVVTLHFESGRIGTVSLSRNGIYGYGIQTEIVGTAGTLQIGYDRETAVLVMTPGQVSHDTVPGFYERFEQAYVSQLENFIENLRHDRPPPITCDDGIAAQRLALAATRSLHRRQPEDVMPAPGPQLPLATANTR